VKLSVVIPAHNEEGSIAETITSIVVRLDREGIDHEVLCVDDGSTDGTAAIVQELAAERPTVRYLLSPYSNGFGMAVRAGLEQFTGDAVAIMMADLSDDPEDLVAYFHLLEAGYDCAFGSRFITGGQTVDYPGPKLLVNRIANLGIRVLFGHGLNDTTNAFKAYRREVIESVQPLVSHHFNLTVELPLKAIVRGSSYAVVPITWRNRKAGESKLKLQEMGSRYAYIVLMVLLEHHLSRGDYRRAERPPIATSRWRTGAPGARPREGTPPDA
jgi:dolichol-phosphate mannosyltransferase